MNHPEVSLFPTVANVAEHFFAVGMTDTSWYFYLYNLKGDPEEIGQGPTIPDDMQSWKLHSVEDDEAFVVMHFYIPSSTHEERMAFLRYLIVYYGL